MKTDVEIYHGDHIGGCVTVINYENNGIIHRIMIDYGASLSEDEPDEKVDYPWDDKPVEAVFFTHYHGDHVGRFKEIPENVPLYMGKATRDVMLNMYRALNKSKKEHKDALKTLMDDNRIHTYSENELITDIEGFTVTPYSIDHSAYDAYMFLIETPDKKGKKVILHTGDFRGHGYRGKNGKTILNIIKWYIHENGRKVDILITEGTMMTRETEHVMTEPELQKEAKKVLEKYKYAFLICSSVNLDSIVSFYQAAKSTGKYMYTYNEYSRQQIKTLSDQAREYSSLYNIDNIYELDKKEEGNSPLESFKSKEQYTQKYLMQKHGFLALIKPEGYCQKYIDRFKDFGEDMVIIYSMWGGYIDESKEACKPEWKRFIDKQIADGIDFVRLHTSGHATPELIAKVIEAVDPQEAIYPIHTENRDGFMELDISEHLKGKLHFN